MTGQRGYHLDKLRLEIETPTDGLPNLIPNPSGSKGAWGWVTPVNNTEMRVSLPTSLTFRTLSAQACYFTSEMLPVAAGRYVSSRLDVRVISAARIRIRYQWFNATRTLLSTSTQSALLGVGVQYGPVAQAPANTAFVALRIDFYSTSGGNAPANAYVTFREAMVTHSATGTPTETRRNLIPNPSFETNTAGWSTTAGTISRTTAQAAVGGASALLVGGGLFGDARAGTSPIPVTAGRDYALSYQTRGTGSTRCWVRWYNAAGAEITSSLPSSVTASPSAWTPTAVVVTAPSSATHAVIGINTSQDTSIYLDAALFEEGLEIRPYFDGSSTSGGGVTYAWTGTAHNSASTRTTSGPVFDYAEPNDWTNILGPTHEIRIPRAGLDVGTLSATVFDAQLDPAEVDLIGPGKQVRVRALVEEQWESVYEGSITRANTNYAHAKGGSLNDKGAVRIELTATDNLAHLSNQGEARTVATVAELPALLEGKGAPWNVNGSGSQIAAAPAVVATNENASIVDQVAITRDTVLGYAWVDRNNVLQVWDAALLGSSVGAELSDVPPPGFGEIAFGEAEFGGSTAGLSYIDIDVSHDTEDCINEVKVNFLRYKPVAGQTEEIPYGPYRDQASIDKYRARSATFTIAARFEDPGELEAYANQILAANAVPVIRCNTLTMPVRNATELAAAARLDLYSLVEVRYADRVADQLRITSIEHTITPGKWSVAYGFSRPTSVAAPTMTPSPPTGGVTSRMQAGTIVPTVGTANVYTDIVFSPPFTNPPIVVATVVDGGSSVDVGLGVNPAAVTTTGATIRTQRVSGTGPVRINWIAIAP